MMRWLASLLCPSIARENAAMRSTLTWYAEELRGARARACLDQLATKRHRTSGGAG